MDARLLLVEDNPADERLVREMLAETAGPSFVLESVDTLSKALRRLVARDIDLVLLDLSLPDSVGIDTVRKVQASAPGVPIIVLTGSRDDDLAIQSIRLGVQDYLLKGNVDAGVLRLALHSASERRRLMSRVIQLEEESRARTGRSIDALLAREAQAGARSAAAGPQTEEDAASEVAGPLAEADAGSDVAEQRAEADGVSEVTGPQTGVDTGPNVSGPQVEADAGSNVAGPQTEADSRSDVAELRAEADVGSTVAGSAQTIADRGHLLRLVMVLGVILAVSSAISPWYISRDLAESETSAIQITFQTMGGWSVFPGLPLLLIILGSSVSAILTIAGVGAQGYRVASMAGALVSLFSATWLWYGLVGSLPAGAESFVAKETGPMLVTIGSILLVGGGAIRVRAMSRR